MTDSPALDMAKALEREARTPNTSELMLLRSQLLATIAIAQALESIENLLNNSSALG